MYPNIFVNFMYNILHQNKNNYAQIAIILVIPNPISNDTNIPIFIVKFISLLLKSSIIRCMSAMYIKIPADNALNIPCVMYEVYDSTSYDLFIIIPTNIPKGVVRQ